MSQLDNAAKDFDISDYDVVFNQSRYEDADATHELQTIQDSRGKGKAKGRKKQKINDDEDETESDEAVDEMLTSCLNTPFVSPLFGYYIVSVLILHSSVLISLFFHQVNHTVYSVKNSSV